MATNNVIPAYFTQSVQCLFAECESHIQDNAAVSVGDDGLNFENIHAHRLENTLVSRLENTLVVIEEGIQLMDSLSEYSDSRHLLLSMWQEAARYIREIAWGGNDTAVPPITALPAYFVYNESVGRPRAYINIEQIELMRTSGYKWEDIAHVFQVSRTTLWRRLKEANITTQNYSDISDHDLDAAVSTFQQQFPNCGQGLLSGHLIVNGIHVQRYRLRESVARTDPIRTALRWHQVISRRTYSVPHANALWHIDGHHSLVRWHFVIHGGIDGYSRLIVYLSCSNNNKAETVLNLFKHATEEFGVPSRVRSDKGGENYQVCHFMVENQGTGRRSHIAGSSVHNQRIERLWRDVYRCVCSSYYEIFCHMEDTGLLDLDCDNDLFVLHCVFLPRINRSLEQFLLAWNSHPIRTAHNWSPRKLWVNSIQNETVDVVPDELYGIDPLGPLPEEHTYTLVVPEIAQTLSDQQLTDFMTVLDTETTFDDFGLEHYLHCKTYLNSML